MPGIWSRKLASHYVKTCLQQDYGGGCLHWLPGTIAILVMAHLDNNVDIVHVASVWWGRDRVRGTSVAFAR